VPPDAGAGSSDPVVRALLVAMAASPSAELRAALGERLLVLNSPAQALEHFEAGLVLDPADIACLEGAARAAAIVGDGAKANAYGLALKGIRGAAVAPATPPPAAPAALPETLAAIPALDTAQREPPRLHVVTDAEAELVPDLRLADVGGMDSVKERLTRSFLLPLRNPGLVRKLGQEIRGGLLLYGPPGCGKTFLARALAGEIGARFVSVALNDVLDMWFGESERKLHELFENARRQKPTILFFDEADALGQRRTQLKGSVGRTLVNQLLTEMDGFQSSNDGLFLLAATNHPWDVDTALRRPGRFDRLVFVPPPDMPARRAILQLKLRARLVAGTVDLDGVAKATEGFSGADLAALVGTAAEMALQASVERNLEVPIDDELLRRALREARPSTRPWFEVARNHALYANEGGVYDELLAYLKQMRLA